MRDLDPKSEFFKAREKEFRQEITPGTKLCLRIDGRAFHTFTKNFKKPYDTSFMKSMDAAAEEIVTTVLTKADFAYIQSDEISIIHTAETVPFGRVEKLLSLSASAASVRLYKELSELNVHSSALPLFDARFFTFSHNSEIEDYVNLRRLDARKNSVTMAAESLYGPEELHGLTTSERLKLLKDTKFEKLPDEFFYGRLLHKTFKEVTSVFVRKDDPTRTPQTAQTLRAVWEIEPASRENFMKLLEDSILRNQA